MPPARGLAGGCAGRLEQAPSTSAMTIALRLRVMARPYTSRDTTRFDAGSLTALTMRVSLRSAESGCQLCQLSDRCSSTMAVAKGASLDKRKQSLYFPEEMLNEIQHEATRLDRSLSWIVQQCWKLARKTMKT